MIQFRFQFHLNPSGATLSTSAKQHVDCFLGLLRRDKFFLCQFEPRWHHQPLSEIFWISTPVVLRYLHMSLNFYGVWVCCPQNLKVQKSHKTLNLRYNWESWPGHPKRSQSVEIASIKSFTSLTPGIHATLASKIF